MENFGKIVLILAIIDIKFLKREIFKEGNILKGLIS
jgi:hypothetical protein